MTYSKESRKQKLELHSSVHSPPLQAQKGCGGTPRYTMKIWGACSISTVSYYGITTACDGSLPTATQNHDHHLQFLENWNCYKHDLSMSFLKHYHRYTVMMQYFYDTFDTFSSQDTGRIIWMILTIIFYAKSVSSGVHLPYTPCWQIKLLQMRHSKRHGTWKVHTTRSALHYTTVYVLLQLFA